MGRDNQATYRKRAQARLCIQQGRFRDARVLYEEICQGEEHDAEAWGTLGAINGQLGEFERAADCFRRSLSLRPGQAGVLFNLAQAYLYLRRLQDAVDVYREVNRLVPNAPDAHRNLGFALQSQQKLDDAIASYRQVLRIQPGHSATHSNLLLLLNYHPDYDAGMIFDEHRRWGEVHADKYPACADRRPDTDPERQLRIGYVSPDLRQHSVAFFLEPLLANRNPAAVHITCYADVKKEAATTQRLKRLADHWHNISGRSDDEVAQLIRLDSIDILVDLAGHTADNRLLVFARRPAPLLVTYLGYPTTTGLKAMDYRLTDSWVDPPGATEQLHTETLLRLPGGFLCYQPPADAPPVAVPPADTRGPVTFGSFNNLTKINPRVVGLWSDILRALPDTRMVIKNNSLHDPATVDNYRGLFMAQGITPDRLDLTGSVPGLARHLAMYGEIDIALDTFPYNGTTTTCEALWMGVPVITLQNNTNAGRVGSSLLRQAGLPELICDRPEDYVDLALALAGDSERRSSLRRELRSMMRSCPLLDGQSFARKIEAAYRSTWRAYCARS